MTTSDSGSAQQPGPEQDPAGEPDFGDDLADLEIPDDLSSLDTPTVEMALVITQVAAAEPLAAACSLGGVDALAVPSDVGVLAVLRQTSPEVIENSMTALTQLIKGVPAILVIRTGEQLTMTRWQDGAAGDQLPAGLVLSGASDELEDLITGAADFEQVPGAVDAKSISRFKAMRLLAAAARKARRR